VVTLDTSALVALLAKRDAHHQRMRSLLLAEKPPYLVPEPVLAELAYLVETRVGPHVMALFLADVEAGAWKLTPVSPHAGRIRQLVLRYADLPLGTVDAAVVAVAEANGGRLLSLDGHFRVLAGEGKIEVIG